MILASAFLTSPLSVANLLLKTMFPKNSAFFHPEQGILSSVVYLNYVSELTFRK
jgi:hypothetical protein